MRHVEQQQQQYLLANSSTPEKVGAHQNWFLTKRRTNWAQIQVSHKWI